MNSLLEEIRMNCEEIEFYQTLFVEEMLQTQSKSQDKLIQEHNASYLLDQIASTAKQTLDLFEQQAEQKKEEEKALVCTDNLDLFYAHLRKIFTWHRNNSGIADEFEVKRKLYQKYRNNQYSLLDSQFTGEEGFGKYLDLNNFFLRFVNLKDPSENDSLFSYLKKFDDFSLFSKQTKTTNAYREYLKELMEYLENFISKSMPLFNLQAFNKDLANDYASSQQERGIWCEKCAKYFAKQTVFDAHVTGKKHMNSTTITPEPTEQLPGSNCSVEYCEHFIAAYAQVLDSKRNDTISNLERKAVQTLREREESEGEEEMEIDQATSLDQEAKIYNPLKLPLDWDGKPIPYWLWKLHGLGTEFPCEICAGFIYMGRKAFDKHFQEWRHAYGMKCLGLTNSRQFYGITTIKDALSLNDKLKHSARIASFSCETMEEYEDESGNVFSRKTFEDLRKQGLI